MLQIKSKSSLQISVLWSAAFSLLMTSWWRNEVDEDPCLKHQTDVRSEVDSTVQDARDLPLVSCQLLPYTWLPELATTLAWCHHPGLFRSSLENPFILIACPNKIWCYMTNATQFHMDICMWYSQIIPVWIWSVMDGSPEDWIGKQSVTLKFLLKRKLLLQENLFLTEFIDFISLADGKS